MRKKMIALSLSSILLFGCGATKPASDGCCEKKAQVTQRDADEKILNGLLFTLITYAILSTLKIN
tara:strand:- start:73 stop:267 length:195 start_codon:yes stop_codon:yes gene_type:complete